MSRRQSHAYVPNELLGRLVGFRIFSVRLVMDHVQLRFDDGPSQGMPVLNCDVMPRMELSTASLSTVRSATPMRCEA
jgi:hypothetical protein